jgi:uroporphyrinogen III methyltransferase/synthase
MKKVVINMRPRHQAAELSQMLLDLGFEPFEFPTLSLSTTGWGLGSVPKDVEWLAVTSANALRFIDDIENLGTYKIAVIGTSTAEALASIGVSADFVSSVAQASAFATEFSEYLGANYTKEIVLLKGSSAGDEFAQTLSNNELRCTEFVTYRVERTTPSKEALDSARDLFREQREGRVSLFLLATSSFALRSFMEFFPEYESQITATPLVAIGPVTEEYANRLHFQKIFCAKVSTMKGLLAALASLSPG